MLLNENDSNEYASYRHIWKVMSSPNQADGDNILVWLSPGLTS